MQWIGNVFLLAFLVLALMIHSTALATEKTIPPIDEISVADFEAVFVVFAVRAGPDWALGSTFRQAAEQMGRIEGAGPLFARRTAGGLTHIGFFTQGVSVAPNGFAVKRWRSYRAATVRAVGRYGTISRHVDRLRAWVEDNGFNATGDLIEIYPDRVDGQSVFEIRLMLGDDDQTVRGASSQTRDAVDVAGATTGTPALESTTAEEPEAVVALESAVETQSVAPADLSKPDSDIENQNVATTVLVEVVELDRGVGELVAAGDLKMASERALPDYPGIAPGSRRWIQLVRDRVRVLGVLLDRKHGDKVAELSQFMEAVVSRCDVLVATVSDQTTPVTMNARIDRSPFLDELDKLIVHVHIKPSGPDELRERIVDLFERMATMNKQNGQGVLVSPTTDTTPD